MKCPVCGRTFKTTVDHSCGHLCEEYGGCQCGYYYEFAFGATRETFGFMEVVTSYLDTLWESRWAGLKSKVYCGLWRFVTFDGCL